MSKTSLERCPYPIHPKEGLKAARALVMLVQAQIDNGSLKLCDAGMTFEALDVTMTSEQFVNFALDALNVCIRDVKIATLDEPKREN